MSMFAMVKRCGEHACPAAGCLDEAEDEVHRSATAARTGGRSSAPGIVQDVVSSPGLPLPARARRSMGERFGYDFGSVRIHTDVQAADSARAVAAEAYAVGPHVVFAAGAYRPDSPAGDRLLAHELAHVVQQPVAPAPSTPLSVSDPADASEREAAAHADAQALPAPSHGPAEVARQDAGTKTTTTPASTPPPAPMTKAQKEALALAKSLETKYPGWRTVLPHCPCTDKIARASADWAGPDACLPAYHPGAVTGYRSAKGYASVKGTNHGQQCCYDAAGLLITEGQAAGTPDVVQAPADVGSGIAGTVWPWPDRPGLGAALKHRTMDVVPFEELGWETYNKYWIPDKGLNCPPNKKP